MPSFTRARELGYLSVRHKANKVAWFALIYAAIGAETYRSIGVTFVR